MKINTIKNFQFFKHLFSLNGSKMNKKGFFADSITTTLIWIAILIVAGFGAYALYKKFIG